MSKNNRASVRWWWWWRTNKKQKRANEQAKKTNASEQHYFWLNEKQSHRGSLRLRETTAVAEHMLRNTTLIRNHEKSKMQWTRLRCFFHLCAEVLSSTETISFSSLHHFVFKEEWKRIATLNVVSAFDSHYSLTVACRATPIFLPSVFDLAECAQHECERINQKQKSIEQNKSGVDVGVVVFVVLWPTKREREENVHGHYAVTANRLTPFVHK